MRMQLHLAGGWGSRPHGTLQHVLGGSQSSAARASIRSVTLQASRCWCWGTRMTFQRRSPPTSSSRGWTCRWVAGGVCVVG